MARKLAAAIAVLALSCMLVACGKAATLSMEALDAVSGVRVTAENAGPDQTASSAGAITVGDGDAIIISPCMDKGGFHLTIASGDGKTVVFDDVAEGRVLFQVDAAPGTYDVTASGEGATGWMTVFAQPMDELAEQDASLAEALEKAGVDSSLLSS